MRSSADWQRHSWPSLKNLNVTQSTSPLTGATVVLAIASLRVDEDVVRDFAVGFWDVYVALYHAKIEQLVYVHPPRVHARPGTAGRSTEL